MSSTVKSYFRSKKRNLRDKWNDGDQRKKAKGGNFDLSLNQDVVDVFSEDIDPPRCINIIWLSKELMQ